MVISSTDHTMVHQYYWVIIYLVYIKKVSRDDQYVFKYPWAMHPQLPNKKVNLVY